MDIFDPKSLIETFGTIGLILIIFAESGLLLGLVFPGDSLLFTAGLLASEHKFGLNIYLVAVGAFVAAVAGAQVGYWLGRRYGPSLFKRPDSRIFKREYVDRSRVFFDKHGAKTIVLARFVPFVRTLVPMMAGIGEMNPGTFFAYNVVGAGLWAAGVTIAGFGLGSAIPNVDKYLLPIIGVVILISLIPPLLEYRKHKKIQKLEHPLDDAEATELSTDLHKVVDD
ncbi:MAG: DedA family protein [Acidimicrobiia bacterium]